MDVLIDWESIPWNDAEGEGLPGYRDKTCVRDGQVVWLLEFNEGYDRPFCTKGHLFYVLSGESTLRMKESGEGIRLRAGDIGVLLEGEANAHRMEPGPGECIQVVLFEQG